MNEDLVALMRARIPPGFTVELPPKCFVDMQTDMVELLRDEDAPTRGAGASHCGSPCRNATKIRGVTCRAATSWQRWTTRWDPSVGWPHRPV